MLLLLCVSHSSFLVSAVVSFTGPDSKTHLATMNISLASALRRTVFQPILLPRATNSMSLFSSAASLRRDARSTYSDDKMTGQYTDVYVSVGQRGP